MSQSGMFIIQKSESLILSFAFTGFLAWPLQHCFDPGVHKHFIFLFPHKKNSVAFLASFLWKRAIQALVVENERYLDSTFQKSALYEVHKHGSLAKMMTLLRMSTYKAVSSFLVSLHRPQIEPSVV